MKANYSENNHETKLKRHSVSDSPIIAKKPPIKKGLLKRITSISLALTGLFTLNTGIWNFFPPFVDSFSPGHAIGACIFCALGLFHILLNWKPLAKYFKGLGWWWVPIGLSLISIVSITVIPVVRVAMKA